MDKVLVALGDRIRELREGKHWSQEEFADRCGLHRTAIGLLERAERNPRLDTLLTLSRALGITVSELLRGLEKRSSIRIEKTILSEPFLNSSAMDCFYSYLIFSIQSFNLKSLRYPKD
jgi:transcriptional regulator with XRE-family HTH domain